MGLLQCDEGATKGAAKGAGKGAATHLRVTSTPSTSRNITFITSALFNSRVQDVSRARV